MKRGIRQGLIPGNQSTQATRYENKPESNTRTKQKIKPWREGRIPPVKIGKDNVYNLGLKEQNKTNRMTLRMCRARAGLEQVIMRRAKTGEDPMSNRCQIRCVKLPHGEGKTKAVSQFQERRERTCVLVETGLAKLPWKNELGRTQEQNASL